MNRSRGDSGPSGPALGTFRCSLDLFRGPPEQGDHLGGPRERGACVRNGVLACRTLPHRPKTLRLRREVSALVETRCYEAANVAPTPRNVAQSPRTLFAVPTTLLQCKERCSRVAKRCTRATNVAPAPQNVALPPRTLLPHHTTLFLELKTLRVDRGTLLPSLRIFFPSCKRCPRA